jgi:uncharacterized protein
MMKLVMSALAGASLMAGTGAAKAASFDCARAKSKIEKAICADKQLSDLDEYLGHYYGGAAETLKDGASCLKADQRDWVKTVRDACGTRAACLENAYLKRLATLDNLQPGASQLKDFELPSVPVMITAIPREADTLPGKAGRPMSRRGKIVFEQVDRDNMGYAVKGVDGAAHAFVYDIDIGNSPTHDTVVGLTEQTGNAQFEVRGFSTPEGGFAVNQCRYVYLLP